MRVRRFVKNEEKASQVVPENHFEAGGVLEGGGSYMKKCRNQLRKWSQETLLPSGFMERLR